MKMRNSFIGVFVIITSLLTGCQEMPIQADYQPTGNVVKESAKTTRMETPELEYKVSWNESCSVQQANTATLQALKDLRLDINTRRTRTIVRRDAETGETVKKQIPVNVEPKMDNLSGVVETRCWL